MPSGTKHEIKKIARIKLLGNHGWKERGFLFLFKHVGIALALALTTSPNWMFQFPFECRAGVNIHTSINRTERKNICWNGTKCCNDNYAWTRSIFMEKFGCKGNTTINHSEWLWLRCKEGLASRGKSLFDGRAIRALLIQKLQTSQTCVGQPTRASMLLRVITMLKRSITQTIHLRRKSPEDTRSGRALRLTGAFLTDLIYMMETKTLTGPDRVMPHELWLSRPDYQEFPLDVFRGHIHKEIKSAKQSNWNEGQKKNEATKQGLYLGIVHFSTLEFSWWVVGYVFWATHKMVRWC